jgi:hypothetical protein
MSPRARRHTRGLRATHVAVAVCILLVLAAACSSPTPSASEPPPSASITLPPPSPTPLPTLTPVRTPPAGGLYVDAAQGQGAISPLVYGTNYGPLLFVPLQMQPSAQEAHLTVLRYPGGNWGDNNDIDLWNLDQFVAFARQIGAEPYICVRLKGGTAEKAADLVRYANSEKGYNVRFWSIGNEPNLFANYSVEQFNAEWREWATAMRAVDPSIMLLGPEVNQFFAYPANDYERNLTRWVTEFLRVNGDMLDVVSFHRYPFPLVFNGSPPSIDDLRADSRKWDQLIIDLRLLVRANAGRDLPIAITEANSSYVPVSGGEATLDSHYNAIWWGDSLGRMIRQGALMVNQFAISSEWGLMGNYEVRPIYYVYRMYQRFGIEGLYASSDDPDVSVFAATTAEGVPTLMIVNLASQPVTKTLTIAGGTVPARAEAWLFDQDHNAEQIKSIELGATTQLTLSPESMLLLIVCDCGPPR